jgi:sulfur carrier protein ThiS
MKTVVVSVKILPKKQKQHVRLPTRAKVASLLDVLDLNPQTVVVRCNGKIVTEGERLVSGDIVEIIPIVTGG